MINLNTVEMSLKIKNAMPIKKDVKPIITHHFSFDTEGYCAAKKWLENIGEWERISTSGFSNDGWSIVATANDIWEKHNSNNS